ncbi:host-nuclease inhibitor Gam family protein [Orenia marismortui]|uniref:host-nuclease inhibitor Gam family protein n=1 Tax=Orenia marismortui TaxID=46469 RepID=UPI000377D9A9|nr:host-nuclease inhibitor Gam family protein [Orenia marismortui]
MSEIKEEVKENQEDRYVIDNDSKANSALRKLRELKAKKQEKEEQAEEFKREIDYWLEKEVSSIDSDIEFYEGILTEYAMNLKESDKELKTHKLPFGSLKFRAQSDKWNYEDDKLVESVEGAGLNDLIKVKKSVDKREFKKLVKVVGSNVINPDTGEVIEGVTIESREEKFSIDI